jgi:hypothetical protein
MGKFIETSQEKDGKFQKAVLEVFEKDTSSKGIIRKTINEEVFDLNDSVADNAKMISLLLSMLKRLYAVNFDTASLSSTDKGTIDYVINKFDTIQTRADVQFAKEGSSMIDKIMDRQALVGSIIK